MKRMLAGIISLLLVMGPVLLSAQQGEDFRILLRSGPFIPEVNAGNLGRNAGLFQNSLYGENHYLTLQFYSLPDQLTKSQLQASGIRLLDYIPNRAYTAVVSNHFDPSRFSQFGIRSIFQFNRQHKTLPELLSGNFPAHAIRVPGYVDITMISYEKLEAARLANSLASINATILEDLPQFRTFTIRVAGANLPLLLDFPFVQWVECIEPPNQAENLLGRSLHRVNVLNDGVRNLKGDGINIGIWDENEVSLHLDFLPAHRVTLMEPTGTTSSHSTHCAGILTGRGLIDHRARGMAPNAKLYSYNFSGSVSNEMSIAIPGLDLSVSSHSYGGSVSTCALTGSQIAYTTTSRNTDINLNNFPNHLHVHSAGNSQGSCAGGWYTITGSGKTAKNNILVANISTIENLSGTSSCGPTADGRIKPEISAFGSSVLSTYTPLNSYGTISGTSMAAPGIAGSAALLIQRYLQLNSGVHPPSSLIKNIICNTATDLGNTGPDYRFGFGRIDALAAVRILEENRYVLNTINNAAVSDHTITVPAGATKLNVMLTWNDPAAAANSNPALVNNLDLSVIESSTTTLPWVLDPTNPSSAASQAVDVISNIEQVTINNPPPGTYTLRVAGSFIPTGPQQYALTWSVDQPTIEVTYPNGTESMNPGSTETITWNNAGISSFQTVQYSLDNGANWTTLSASVPATTTRLAWTVPAANTSTALVRVFSGSVTDNSDAPFRILGTPTGFTTNAASCTAGEISFNWTAVNNATHYDILTLDILSGEWMVLTSNISGTSYTATGLTPNASMWFTIIAKNNTTGSASVRALAINRTVSAGGVSAIGSINGQTTICGTPSGIMYSVAPVSGATSYSWSLPAGATISSGQGTNSILVDFPAGAASGNVSVFAQAGMCQTATATLPITVGGLAVAPPASGGNQTQFYCAPDPVPTLTATATVPAGHTVIWYDAPTAGNIVNSPVLNSVGTITYYAASVNNTSNCESNTRTAVELTINTAPAATITAGGPISFCEGGNVVLTASPGTSYAWSNGATTQSITVSASGDFSVIVTQPGGCASNSPVTAVTVNPLPAAVVNASGPLAFCQGENVVLTASGGNSYSWNNGSTTPSITVNSSGNYTVTVTNAAGCSTTSAATIVNVTAKPVVTLSASPFTSLFPGLTTTLSANVSPSGTVNYVWTRNGTVMSGVTTATIPVTLDGLGDYAVTVTNAGGCTNTSTLLSINDSVTTRLFIYPNPNAGQFQVSYHSSALAAVNYSLSVYDSKGALVFRQVFTINTPYQRMDIDMRKQAKGVYQVVLHDRSGKRLASEGVVIQ